MFKTDNIQSPYQREQEEVRCSAQLSQNAYAERLIPPLVEEETPLHSSDGGGEEHTDRKEIT
jgi:hypothetical protein